MKKNRQEWVGIVALDQARGMGLNGKMPWHVPGDLKWFRENTLGFPVTMGGRTAILLDGKLKGRVLIAISRKHLVGFKAVGSEALIGDVIEPMCPDRLRETAPCFSVTNAEDAVTLASRFAKDLNRSRVYVGGGAETFRMLLPRLDRFLITRLAFTARETDVKFSEEWLMDFELEARDIKTDLRKGLETGTGGVARIGSIETWVRKRVKE